MSTLIYVAMHGGQPTHTALTVEAAQRDALQAQRQQANGAPYDYKWMDSKPGEWRLWKKPRSKQLVPAEKTARTIVAVALTPDEKTVPVDGPFPVRVAATPSGAELDVSAYLFQAVFTELITKADDEPQELVDELRDMADLMRSAIHGGRNCHARHEFDERMVGMLKEYAGEGLIPVYGDAVRRLAERLAEIATPRPVPGQREAGAA